MSEFLLYFDLGFDHILDLNGYDHMLFVVALCATYVMSDWKKLLVLVTAFTIGHSLTLALSTLRLVNFDSSVIEFLIPLTIFLTAFTNLFRKDRPMYGRKIQLSYVIALVFGLIHGLGFSNYLRALLGKDADIIFQLFAFNVGLEIGQIIIVFIFMIISFVVIDIFGVTRRDWKMVISSAIAGMAVMLMLETKFW
ncbi:HupE/UreJ family protein [Fulvivirga lutimaris]|uniref:HupE/UreJ family protein n=1 Tax=Fulvivirga lutimaris TaxID=1819566 RepID=UPI0012BD6FDF|nr:HupE/UreJ family protein [Fulvivirga lutimaris]MTI41979.1 HupE/UreJ family protein [Fulvivirga lutimaris]